MALLFLPFLSYLFCVQLSLLHFDQSDVSDDLTVRHLTLKLLAYTHSLYTHRAVSCFIKHGSTVLHFHKLKCHKHGRITNFRISGPHTYEPLIVVIHHRSFISSVLLLVQQLNLFKHSFHLMSHPYRAAHLRGKTRLVACHL